MLRFCRLPVFFSFLSLTNGVIADYSEMLSSGFLDDPVAQALNDFRESHTGTLSGMTRYTDHLDDMPASGYAHSAVSLRRTESYQALLFGHIANYHSRGSYNAPEQLSL